MKKSMIVAFGLLLCVGAVATASGPIFLGTSSVLTQADLQPVADDGADLFPCVVYRDTRKIHPCAVPKVVKIVDPCFQKDCCDPCAQPGCVAVQICVPPCSCCPPVVKCTRDGKRVKYDYGKCEVVLTSRGGKVYVNYN